MKDRSIWILIAVFMVSLSPFAASLNGTAFAQEEEVAADVPAEQAEQAEPADESNGPMTEGELAGLLVNVLGLAPLLPPNPQDADVYAILLQNGIGPKDGWNPTNYVTEGNMARILVQSMDRESEIENSEDDGEYVALLNSLGISFDSVTDAVGQTPTLNDPVAIVAIDPSTDPLRKIPSIRPSDEQQLGADLQAFTTQLTAADIIRIILETERPEPEEPDPTTPS